MSQPIRKEPPLDAPDTGPEVEECERCEAEHCIHCHCWDCAAERRSEYEQSKAD